MTAYSKQVSRSQRSVAYSTLILVSKALSLYVLLTIPLSVLASNMATNQPISLPIAGIGWLFSGAVALLALVQLLVAAAVLRYKKLSSQSKGVQVMRSGRKAYVLVLCVAYAIYLALFIAAAIDIAVYGLDGLYDDRILGRLDLSTGYFLLIGPVLLVSIYNLSVYRTYLVHSKQGVWKIISQFFIAAIGATFAANVLLLVVYPFLNSAL